MTDNKKEDRIIKLAAEIGLLKIECKKSLEDLEEIVNYIDRAKAYTDKLLIAELDDDIKKYIELSDKLRKKRNIFRMYTETVRYISIEREDQ